jgi:hypothetical protein
MDSTPRPSLLPVDVDKLTEVKINNVSSARSVLETDFDGETQDARCSLQPMDADVVDLWNRNKRMIAVEAHDCGDDTCSPIFPDSGGTRTPSMESTSFSWSSGVSDTTLGSGTSTRPVLAIAGRLRSDKPMPKCKVKRPSALLMADFEKEIEASVAAAVVAEEPPVVEHSQDTSLAFPFDDLRESLFDTLSAGLSGTFGFASWSGAEEPCQQTTP